MFFNTRYEKLLTVQSSNSSINRNSITLNKHLKSGATPGIWTQDARTELGQSERSKP